MYKSASFTGPVFTSMYVCENKLKKLKAKESFHSFGNLASSRSDAFIDLLVDELLPRGLSPTGELEDLWQWLMDEVVLEDKLHRHLEKLQHCDALDACMIALLHKMCPSYLCRITIQAL